MNFLSDILINIHEVRDAHCYTVPNIEMEFIIRLYHYVSNLRQKVSVDYIHVYS